MTPERWRRIDELFAACVGLAEPDRSALLAEQCAEDASLRAVVERMLRADATEGDALGRLIGESASEAAEESVDQWQGRMLGAYKIERRLGAGGMGTVFLARRSDAEYERLVAIKALSNVFASIDERRRFVSERQILANLTHPNIAQLLDGGTTPEGVPYLVLEYIEGSPIDEFCAQRKTPLEERLHLFLQVCSAVQYAHRNLVIHRDIKPANILVTADGAPKLLDFGIAKLLDATAMPRTVAETMIGARLLTPRHASPEQVRGEPVTTASDVYSLGVLLYRLLTERYPYDMRDGYAGEVEKAILETQPQRPSAALARPSTAGSRKEVRARRRALAGDLDNIVLTALRKEPERRYGTVRELAHDIECYLARRPIAARRDSTAYRLRKFVERHKAGVAASAAAIAAFIALVSFHTMRLAEERDLQASERAAAERVSQFMVDIFRIANPESGQLEVTARELLDQGYRQIEREFEGRPLLSAKLMLAMGRAYGGLAMYDRSFELVRDALSLRRRHLEADDPDVAEALHYLGSTQADRSNYASARENLEAALAIRERRLGADALGVAETLTRIAFVDMREAKYPAMRAALERALAIYTEKLGPSDRRTGDAYALLGSYHWTVGEHPQARDATSRALAIEEGLASPNNVRVAAFIHSLGLLAWQLGEYPQAIELYKRELELRRKHLGAEHPTVALTLYGLGTTSSSMGAHREAFAYLREAAALQEKVLGPHSHHLAMTFGGYGFALLRIEEYAPARAALLRSLAIFEASVGREHPDLRAPLAGLSKAAIADGRLDEALERMERARRIVDAKFAPDHPDVLRTHVSLADVFRARGDHVRALEYYERSIAAFERTLGLEHPYAADALCGVSDSLARTGELQRAEQYYELARANLSARESTRLLPSTARCLEGHAALLRRLGRRAQADEAAAEARRIRDYVRAARLDAAANSKIESESERRTADGGR